MAHILALKGKGAPTLDLDNLPATDAECTREMLVACRDRIFGLEEKAEKKAAVAKKRKAAAASEDDAGEAASAPAAKKGSKDDAGKATFTDADLKKFKAALVKKVVRAIKKTGHNEKKKPYTTVTEGIISREFGSALFPEGLGTVKVTKQMEKHLMETHEDIAAWLGLTENAGTISDVKFDGAVWHFIAIPMPKVLTCRVAFESLDASIKGNSLTLKFRTFIP